MQIKVLYLKKSALVSIILAALCAAFISVCSWISIPLTVPFTLQTFAIFGVLMLFGAKVGLLATVVYILLGLVGLPVFSGFRSGAGVLFGATGGYIIGFLFIGIIFAISQKLFGEKPLSQILSLFVGLVVCYAFGTVWFWAVYTKTNGDITIAYTLSVCVLPFIIPDIIKLLLAAVISKKLRPVLKKYQN